MHPDVPGEDESEDMYALCADLGFEATCVMMDDDAPEELWDAYFYDRDPEAVSRWTPTPPNGDGWTLVSVYDCEDGPGAMFVRPNAGTVRLAESQSAPVKS